MNNIVDSVVHHRNTYDYNFDIINASSIKMKQTWSQQKSKEKAHIDEMTTINFWPGFFYISSVLTKLIFVEYGILKNINKKK